MYKMAEGQRYKHDRDPKSEKFVCRSGDYDVFLEPMAAKNLTGFITLRNGYGGTSHDLSEIYLTRTDKHEPWMYLRHKHWQGSLGGTGTSAVTTAKAIEAFNAAFAEGFAEPGKVTLGDALDRMSI